MNYNPLRFMWCVTFDDGLCTPQFDPDTGEEFLWKDIDIDRISKISWVTISPELSQKILRSEGLITHPSILPEIYTVRYEDGDIPLVYRRNFIDYSSSGILGRRTIYVLGKLVDNREEIVYELE